MRLDQPGQPVAAARHRPATRRLLTAILAGLLVASCAGGEGSDGPTRGPERDPVRVDESLGVVRIAPGASLDLGFVLDTDDPALAALLAEAFRVGVEDYGAVQGFRVALGEPIAAECSTESGAAAAEQLLGQPGAGALVGVVGPICDATLRGLQGPVTAAGLVVVAPRSSDPELTQNPLGAEGPDRVDGVWRTAPNLLSLAVAAAGFAGGELELDRAGIVLGTDPVSEGLAAEFRRAFESAGGTVVATLPLGPDAGEEQLLELLGLLADARPEVVLFALPPEELLPLAERWDEQPQLRDVVRVITDQAAVPSFLGDPASEDHYLVTPWLDVAGSSSGVTGMDAAQVIERMDAALGVRTTSGWWAYAYDAMTLLLRAIDDSSVVDRDGSLVVSRAELRASLTSATFRGMTGTLACDGFGDCAPARAVVRLHLDVSVTDPELIEVVHDSGP